MSDNLPLEVQVEIINRLPVKSLIQFRSVSKAWKSLIDSSHFIARYSSQHSQVQQLLVKYGEDEGGDELNFMDKYVLLADDDTFPHQKVFPTVPTLVNMLQSPRIIGCSHGLLCLYGFYSNGLRDFNTKIAVIWNLSIRKSVPVVVPNVENGEIYQTVIGFGVCRDTTDSKIVKITYINSSKDMESISCIPSQVEVFTLSTRVWRNPYNNLPRKSIKFNYEQVAVDGFLYWLATDDHRNNGIGFFNLIVSFDLTSEEFREVNLPDSLAQQSHHHLSMFKLRDSLVMFEHFVYVNNQVFNVWVMEDGVFKMFTKVFNCDCNAPHAFVRGFRKSGEPIIEKEEEDSEGSKLAVYDPYLKLIDVLGVEQIGCLYSLYPYMETLLLLDQPNFTSYTEEEILKYVDDLGS